MRATAWIVVLYVFAVAGILTAAFARAAHGAELTVPARCWQYQRELTAQARSVFGLNAPVADLAAQIHQESGCRADAASPVGASGLTQFMPSTATWLAGKYPTRLGPADPYNWRWAIAAQVLYMHDLTRDNPGATECDTFAFGFSSYNGGEGWLHRDQGVCRAQRAPYPGHCAPCDDERWFDNVELSPDPRRSAAAVRENRGYPQRIMLQLAPVYTDAGWGRSIECGAQP